MIDLALIRRELDALARLTPEQLDAAVARTERTMERAELAARAALIRGPASIGKSAPGSVRYWVGKHEVGSLGEAMELSRAMPSTEHRKAPLLGPTFAQRVALSR